MKYLCICQYGHSRSVALARLLHGMGQGAVAIGWSTNGGAITPLCEWADRILIVDGHALAHVPINHRHKAVDFQVGPDRWVDPYHPELAQIFERLVAERLPELQGAQ